MTACDIADTLFAVFTVGRKLISRLWEQGNKKQTWHSGLFTCILCIAPSGRKFSLNKSSWGLRWDHGTISEPLFPWHY